MREILLLVMAIVALLSAIAAMLIAKKVHDSLMHSGNKNYIGLSVLSFIASFLVIGLVLALIAYMIFSK